MIGLFLVMIYFPIKIALETCWTFLNINPRVHETLYLITPSIILTLVSTPIVVILIVISWLYKAIVQLILKLKLGNDYVRLITGCNVMSCMQIGKEPPCITLLMMVKSDMSGDKFYNIIKNRIHEVMQDPKFAQLFCLREKFMDYLYLRKSNLQPEEVVKTIDVRNERELVRFMNAHKMSDLARDNTGHFDVAIGSRILEDNGGYPLVIRIHHCLTDGLSFYSTIRKLFCNLDDGNHNAYFNDLSAKMLKSNDAPPANNILKDNLRIFRPQAYPHDIFEDHSGESEIVMSFVTEPEIKYVPLVKKIKNRIPGMPFNAILLGAFSASIAEYYTNQKPSDEIPEYFSVGMPVQIKKERFQKAYDTEEPPNFENDYSICYYNLPIIPKSKKDVPISDYLIDRLVYLKEEFQHVSKFPEFMTNYALMKILGGVLPFTIAEFIYSLGSITTTASCLPGGPMQHLFHGDKIQDFVFCTPKHRNMSICLCILTYDNRVQMSLQTSKERIPDSATLDKILHGVFRALDVMDEKTKLLYESC